MLASVRLARGLAAVFAAAALSAQPARAHGVADQQQLLTLPPCYNIATYFGTAAVQSFTPSASTLVAMDMKLNVLVPTSAQIFVYQGECPGPLVGLATTSATLGSTGEQVVHVDLPSTVALTPGQKYSVVVQPALAPAVEICGATVPPDGPYAAGAAYNSSCDALPGADGYFVSYADGTTTTTTTMEPTTTSSTTTLEPTTTTTLEPADCGATPRVDCLGGDVALLLVKNGSDDSKDLLKWKLKKTGAFDHAALGDPLASRDYSLCIYDETAGIPSLATTLTIAAGSGWTSKDPKGFLYLDSTAASDGVTKALLKTGEAGKGSVSVMAKGVNVEMPEPFSSEELFDVDADLTVQLVNSDSSLCWSSSFSAPTLNTGAIFKAKAP